MKNKCNRIAGAQKRLIFLGIFIMLVFVKSINLCQAQLVFKTSIQTPDASGYDYSIADLNNDSFPDIYISAHAGGMSAGHPGYIWMNNGNGSFTAKQTIGYPAVTHKVAFADLDADGDIDLFLANDASYADVTGADPKYYPGCPNEVWFNDGTGNFTNSGQLLGYEPSLAIKLADVDGDGDIDAVVGNYHPGGTLADRKYKADEVWLNDGKGFFALSQKLGYGMSSPSLVDFDTDGDLDALVQDTLWLNDGHGKFAKSNKVFKFGDNVNALEFGDLNNDGYMDAFIGNWNAPAEVWLNDSSSNLINSGQKLGNLNCGNVKLIDIDNDGDLDAFTDNYGGPCKLWINQGGKQNGQTGKFNESGLNLPTGRGILCDLNKDGKQDAIIGNKVWINEYVETSVNELFENNKVIFSPNPTSGSLTISIGTTPVDDALVTIYNLQGAQVFSKTFQNAQSATIDLTGNSAGIYVVKVIADGVSYEKKIMKE